jgi:multidrug efflux pump subunit AcrA (membrane-fusion protein)
MPSVELRSEHARQSDGSAVPRPLASNQDNTKRRIPIAPILLTLGTVTVAALLAWTMWQAYMGAPWTRDGTVRAYVVTMAPEVAGRIVKLPAADNQLVHKAMCCSKSNRSTIASRSRARRAQAQRDGAALDYARANEGRQATLEGEGWVSKNIYQQSASTLHQL